MKTRLWCASWSGLWLISVRKGSHTGHQPGRHELVGTLERGKNPAQVVPDDSRQLYTIFVKLPKKLKVKAVIRSWSI